MNNIYKMQNIKIIVLLVVMLLSLVSVDFASAEKHEGDGPYFSDNPTCGNFDYKGVHYSGSERCSVLGGNYCTYCGGVNSCSPGNVSQSGSWAVTSSFQGRPMVESISWQCQSSDGFNTRSCGDTKVHGICNPNPSSVYFNPRTGVFEPTTGTVCISGSLGGPQTWTSGTNAGSSFIYSCLGSNGGTSDTNCSWTPPPMAGICGGPFWGRIISKNIPTAQQGWDNLCSSGPQSSITTTLISNLWNCLGTYGGANASCNATIQPGTGKCNDLFAPSNTNSVNLLPADGFLCKAGSVKEKTSFPDPLTNLWTWKCAGSGGYADSGTCSVKYSTSTDATTDSTLVDEVVKTQKITVTGRITPNIVNKGQYCTLTDLNYVLTPKNANAFVVCNVHKGKKADGTLGTVVLDADLSKDGHQVAPGYDYYYSCQDLTSRKIADPVVLKCVLNPSIIER